MKTNHNGLPEVNQFIKENNLTPCEAEKMCGSLYSESDDITYIVVNNDNTYISYSLFYYAHLEWVNHDVLLFICRGKINDKTYR
jgi:hypothetical protein